MADESQISTISQHDLTLQDLPNETITAPFQSSTIHDDPRLRQIVVKEPGPGQKLDRRSHQDWWWTIHSLKSGNNHNFVLHTVAGTSISRDEMTTRKDTLFDLYDKIKSARADPYILLRDPNELTCVASLIAWAWLPVHHWLDPFAFVQAGSSDNLRIAILQDIDTSVDHLIHVSQPTNPELRYQAYVGFEWTADENLKKIDKINDHMLSVFRNPTPFHVMSDKQLDRFQATVVELYQAARHEVIYRLAAGRLVQYSKLYLIIGRKLRRELDRSLVYRRLALLRPNFGVFMCKI